LVHSSFSHPYAKAWHTEHVPPSSLPGLHEYTTLFHPLLQGEFFISGFTNKQLRQALPNKSASQVTRLLKRLRVHGIIRNIGKRYKYYLTDFGREVASMALKLRELVVIPQLAFVS
jgi:hypothetical protein